GFPTLKWGDPSNLQDCNGGRSYEDLKQFADENLKSQCTIKNVDLCDNEKRAQIEKYQGMSVEELSAEEDGKMKAAEKKFEEEVEKLQARYEQLSKEKDDAIAGIKAAGLGLLKSILRSKAAPEPKDELYRKRHRGLLIQPDLVFLDSTRRIERCLFGTVIFRQSILKYMMHLV
ncbi:hypothetical protein ACHAW5_007132, partial [Stephanodiscus triporus]